MSDPQLMLLPGLCADHRLFNRQREAFPNLQTPAWLEPQPEESLESYAIRCADHWFLGEEPIFDLARPFWLGGISFGGMLAMEIGGRLAEREHAPAGVILISSCRSGDVVSDRFMGRQAVDSRIPDELRRNILVGPATTLFTSWDRLCDEDTALVREMAEDTDLDFLRWAASACVDWKLSHEEAAELPFPIHQIHGRKNRIIPLCAEDADHVLENGGHLINLGQADEVNRYLLSCVEGAKGSSTE
ncbi:alpha/beta fold hydrolase [Calycomorphotria hydatis]|uniref:Alpha/beta hydrolase family protein n=1 Tax=Calycomorphotria hydatis TaxID=2528027 RepID=A0A517T476_9PLAN|nr:alpha/beta fold hydrolase [Calycomorphotria hydatis]QDT63169.1 Alpha/beta hydrolase family protein [Calycomorphotria hydatis]